jgi:hypothetical protein
MTDLAFGMNLVMPAAYLPFLPTIDLALWRDAWQLNGGTYDKAKPPAIAYNAHGYPAAVPPGVTRLQTVMRCAPGTNTYVLEWEGEADVSFNMGGMKQDAPTYDAARGKYFRTALLNAPNAALLIVVNSVKDPGAFRNLTVTHYADRPLLLAGRRWQEAFLAPLRGFSKLRFLGWMRTNFSTWTDRLPDLSAASWAGPGGVPVEAMADLCNVLGVPGHFTLPHLMTDEAVADFVDRLKSPLDPGLQAGIAIEHSNEKWNWGFSQAQYAMNEANRLWAVDSNKNGVIDPAESIGDGFLQWSGFRAAQVAKIVRARSPFRNVITTQPALPTYMQSILKGVARAGGAPSDFDDVAITAYVIPPDAATLLPWIEKNDRDEMFDWIRGTSMPWLKGVFTAWQKIAVANGWRLVGYEGNLHLNHPAGIPADKKAAVSAYFAAIARDDRVASVWFDLMAAFRDAGGAELCLYNDHEVATTGGEFGLFPDMPVLRASLAIADFQRTVVVRRAALLSLAEDAESVAAQARAMLADR